MGGSREQPIQTPPPITFLFSHHHFSDDSKSTMANGKFAKDALVMDRSTKVVDILDYLRRRTSNPIIREDSDGDETVIWNMSSHQFNESAFQEIEDNLHRDEYVIPYSVGPVWGSMMPMLPRRIQEAEVLRFHPPEQEYRAHHNYLRDMTEGEIVDIREELGQNLQEAVREM